MMENRPSPSRDERPGLSLPFLLLGALYPILFLRSLHLLRVSSVGGPVCWFAVAAGIAGWGAGLCAGWRTSLLVSSPSEEGSVSLADRSQRVLKVLGRLFAWMGAAGCALFLTTELGDRFHWPLDRTLAGAAASVLLATLVARIGRRRGRQEPIWGYRTLAAGSLLGVIAWVLVANGIYLFLKPALAGGEITRGWLAGSALFIAAMAGTWTAAGTWLGAALRRAHQRIQWARQLDETALRRLPVSAERAAGMLRYHPGRKAHLVWMNLGVVLLVLSTSFGVHRLTERSLQAAALGLSALGGVSAVGVFHVALRALGRAGEGPES